MMLQPSKGVSLRPILHRFALTDAPLDETALAFVKVDELGDGHLLALFLALASGIVTGRCRCEKKAGLATGFINGEGTEATNRHEPSRRRSAAAVGSIAENKCLRPALLDAQSKAGQSGIPDVVALPPGLCLVDLRLG